MKQQKTHILETVGVVTVVASLVFVGMQLVLDRRIAVGTASMQLTAMAQEFNLWATGIEQAELLHKLHEGDSELTPAEIELAAQYLYARINVWNASERALESGLIEENVFQVYLADIESTFMEYPKLSSILGMIRERRGAFATERQTAVENSRVLEVLRQSAERESIR